MTAAPAPLHEHQPGPATATLARSASLSVERGTVAPTVWVAAAQRVGARMLRVWWDCIMRGMRPGRVHRAVQVARGSKPGSPIQVTCGCGSAQAAETIRLSQPEVTGGGVRVKAALAASLARHQQHGRLVLRSQRQKDRERSEPSRLRAARESSLAAFVNPATGEGGVDAAPAALVDRFQAQVRQGWEPVSRVPVAGRVAQLEQRIRAATAAGVQLSPEHTQPREGEGWHRHGRAA